jgi:diguanylate cyclase (GGDEF)-like protein
MATILRLQIYGFCIIIIAILWFSGDRRKASRVEVDTRLYQVLLLSTTAMVLLDSIAWYFDGKPGTLYRNAVFTANILYYIVHTIPIAFFILYADFQIFREEKRFIRLAVPLILVEVCVTILAVLSPFTGILFFVDGANHYFRGPWFPLFAVLQYGLVAFILDHVLRNKKRVNRRIFITLLAYPLPSLVAAILQMLFYGLVLLWPTMTLFLIVAAFNIENRRAKTDYLTGTANRRSLDEELERRIEFTKSGRTLCGLLLDIDDFKEINDRYGHEAGDRALEDVANILLSSVRVEDHVARMGGDEFVVLIDFEEPIAMEELVHRIESAIENLNASHQRPYQVSLSIGRSIYDPTEGYRASEFLAALDSDMYARKKDRKTRN